MRMWNPAGTGAWLRVPGYPSLITAVFLSRMANSMSQVGVVIYLLERTGSPAVAGAGAAAQLLPGIASGPFVGAWLDRASSRRRVIVITVMARAAILAAVIALGELAGTPVVAELILLAGLGVTFPVPTVGFRSLVPVLVPRRLWDQANAADSMTFDAAFVAGPALAGRGGDARRERRSRSRSRQRRRSWRASRRPACPSRSRGRGPTSRRWPRS